MMLLLMNLGVEENDEEQQPSVVQQHHQSFKVIVLESELVIERPLLFKRIVRCTL